jgi:hypothetical protein
VTIQHRHLLKIPIQTVAAQDIHHAEGVIFFWPEDPQHFLGLQLYLCRDTSGVFYSIAPHSEKGQGESPLLGWEPS